MNTLSYSHESLHISIQSQTDIIEDIVSYFQSHIDRFCRIHRLEIVDSSLCLREALANAIIHGNLEIPSTLKEKSWGEFEALVREREMCPEFADRQVIVRCRLTSEYIRLEVEDQGSGFDSDEWQRLYTVRGRALKDCDSNSILPGSGRGLHFIQSFMDNVFWNGIGNCITMIKYFQRSKSY